MSPRRKFNGPPNRYTGPLYARFSDRLLFEAGAKTEFPDLRSGKVKGGYEYRVSVPVPYYGSRKVRIRFSGSSDVPHVFVDGPPESPHRYSDNSLCIWYPKDPVKLRWVFENGLLPLIGLVMAHLFREAWWRETGEWAGEEAPHDQRPKEKSRA